MINIYTDGSCRGNPGPGGIAVILKQGELYKEFSKGFRMTTNNRMELLAVIEGLEAIKLTCADVTVFSDSKYVIDSVTKGYLKKWEKNNWHGKKSIDLWKRFLKIYAQHNVKFEWIRGHNNHPENEQCDKMALAATKGAEMEADTEYEKELTFKPIIMGTKTAGIAADNYKLDKFKQELTDAGFTFFSVSKLTKNTSLIKVNVPEEKLKEVQNLCTKVEMHFKQSN